MLDNCNLVIYDGYSKPIWSSNILRKVIKPCHLIMQIDRNLVLYDAYHEAIWASNTARW
jgi:hypothetical protein